jgi:hypothetical protein
VLQHVLKMLLSQPNELSTTAEDAVTICSSSPGVFEFPGFNFYSESFQSVFLQPNYVHIKPELPLSFTVAVVTIFWPFVQTFAKQSSPELRNVLHHFPAEVLETQQH